jgi:hypothetical protein
MADDCFDRMALPRTDPVRIERSRPTRPVHQQQQLPREDDEKKD